MVSVFLRCDFIVILQDVTSNMIIRRIYCFQSYFVFGSQFAVLFESSLMYVSRVSIVANLAVF